MRGQVALQVDLASGGHRRIPLDSCPTFIGALDICVDPGSYGLGASESAGPLTAIGNGPLAASGVPGCDDLVVATESTLWAGTSVSTFSGAGLPFDGLSCAPLILSGRAARPSVLLVQRVGGTVRARLDTLDPRPLWRGGRHGEGSRALIGALVQRYARDHRSLVLIATGPAAEVTSYGALLVAVAWQTEIAPVIEVSQHGGLGSMLWQRHGLCAVVVGSDRSRLDLLTRSRAVDLPKTPPDQPLTLAELEQLGGYRFDPRLVAEGPLVNRLLVADARVLCFNGTSIYWSLEAREDFAQRVIRPAFLSPIRRGLSQPEARHADCGSPCPVRCKKLVPGAQARDYVRDALLGPQLGVFDVSAIDGLIDSCLVKAFDVATAAAAVGWLMERLYRKALAPDELGLAAQPRWTREGFDPRADSLHNAKLAGDLLDGLLVAPWARDLRNGLRAAAATAGEQAARLLIALPRGANGEAAIDPTWTLGSIAPLPLPGEQYGYQGGHFLSPRVLGRNCAERLVARVAQANHGLCALHRGWSEQRYPELYQLTYGESAQWWQRHRAIAQRLFAQSRSTCWPAGRMQDWVEQLLRHQQRTGAPDGELDAWVVRFDRGGSSAARSLWSEIDSGIAEGLTT